MKKLKLSLLAILAVAVFFTSCKKDEDTVVAKNIVELAVGTADLSSLVAALKKAGLDDDLAASGTFTVFAPTNAAFAAFLTANGFDNLEAVPVATLQKLLLNHVLGSKKKAADITTGYVKTIGKYGTTESYINMYLSTASGVKINGISAVTTPDIEASNGVVHIVDKVIPLPTVVTFALADPTFSTLVAALTDSRISAENLVPTLSGTASSPFTVFAPTNAAFTSLLTELSATGLADIGAGTLAAVLKYHVVAGANVLAGTLTNGQIVTTFLGQTFTIGLPNPKITDQSSRVSNIIVTDVQASNGIIHAIDKVLLPGS